MTTNMPHSYLNIVLRSNIVRSNKHLILLNIRALEKDSKQHRKPIHCIALYYTAQYRKCSTTRRCTALYHTLRCAVQHYTILRHCTTQYSTNCIANCTTRHSTDSTALHYTVQKNTTLHSTAQHNTTQHFTTQYSSTLYSTALRDAVPHYTTPHHAV
jgi:hypothetical protein